MIWTRGKDLDGYGRTFYQKKQWIASRLSFYLAFGEIPTGKQILHRCDTPACVNPNHLFSGTPAENVKDCIVKGRRIVVRGSRRAFAKLSEQDVVEIRKDYLGRSRDRNMYFFARKYNVSPTTIHAVIQGRSWKHVKVVSEKNMAWAVDWKYCQNCFKTESKHAGHGLCEKCYQNIFYNLLKFSKFFGIEKSVREILNQAGEHYKFKIA